MQKFLVFSATDPENRFCVQTASVILDARKLLGNRPG